MDDTTAADIIKSFATTHVSATADPSAPSADDVRDAGPGADLAQALFLAAEALESRARLAARRQAALDLGPEAEADGVARLTALRTRSAP